LAECQDPALGKVPAQGGTTWLLCRVPRLSAKSLPNARNPTLGKDPFAVGSFAEWRLPSVTLDNEFYRVQTGLSLLSHSRWHITEPGPSFCPSVSRWNKNKIFCLRNQGLRRELIWSNKEHQKITRFCNELNQFLLLDKQSKLKQKSTFCFASIMLEPN